jgi:thymidylate synthase
VNVEWHVQRLRDSYEQIARDVVEYGDRTSPRGQATYEVQGATIVLYDPAESLPVGINRGLNLGIAAAEALQLIGGVSYPELMVKVAGNFAQFRDDGTFHGAYGPRVRPQLSPVVERLRHDRSSRQAIVVLWDPLHDLMVDDSKDYPCTIALQFVIRGGELHMHTFMRSNDVWWGLPYDMFQFTQLQFTVAHALAIPVGWYWHHVNSLHVYERNLEDIDKLKRVHPAMEKHHPPALGVGFNHAAINDSMIIARGLLTGWNHKSSMLTPSESWYMQTLEQFVA